MKVLMLSQGRHIDDQPDYDISFRNAQCEGRHIELLNIPFRGYIEKYGCSSFYNEVVRANCEFKPDLVFFQFFHSNGLTDPTSCIHSIRKSANQPLVFGSLGDLFDTGILRFMGRPIPSHTLQLAACADAFFTTSMGNISDYLVNKGARNVVFLPHAFCPMHFPDWDSEYVNEKKYGIVMLCSNGSMVSRFPLRAFNNTFRRRALVWRLHKHFGNNFSLFGRGWGGLSSCGTIPFKDQVNIYRMGKVVIDAPAPVINTTYYSSDRAFFMLGSGVPLIHFHTPRFEKMLRADEHAFYANNSEDAVQVGEKLLTLTEDQLHARRKTIISFIKKHHLIDHRIDTILSTAEAIKNVRDGKMSAASALNLIRMRHFLPEVDLREEHKYAVANWIG